MPKVKQVKAVLGRREHYGPNRKPNLINLNKEVDHQEIGCQPMHRTHLEARDEYT